MKQRDDKVVVSQGMTSSSQIPVLGDNTSYNASAELVQDKASPADLHLLDAELELPQ